METLDSVFLFFVICLILALFYFLFRKFDTLEKKQNQPDEQEKLIFMLQNQIQELSRSIDTKMFETQKSISQNQQHLHQTLQTQFGQSSQIFNDVTKHLAKLDATNSQIVNVADQLQNFENILKSPKQRGILGEYFLQTLLENVLPPTTFKMQYRFKNGDIVDAVIFVKEKIIPIDSKFSLENYNKIVQEKDPKELEYLQKTFKQDIKNRIEETAKYIRPEEGTMDFAFMFIPSEGIYYDLIINEQGPIKINTRDLIDYAFKEKRVIIVSPTSFFAYLQTVLQGLRALQIEESAKEIRKHVEQLSKHLLTYDDYMQKLGKQMGTTVNAYNILYKEFQKIDKDIVKIVGTQKTIEPLVIQKPEQTSIE